MTAVLIPDPRFLIIQSVSIHEPQAFDNYYGELRGNTSFVAEYKITIRESDSAKATEIIEKIRQGESIVDAQLYDLNQNKLVSEKEYLVKNQKRIHDRDNDVKENWSWSISHPQIQCSRYENVFTVRYCLSVDFKEKAELLRLVELYMDKNLFKAAPKGEKTLEEQISDLDIEDILKDLGLDSI